MIQESEHHAWNLLAENNDHRAFQLRWRGLDWTSIQDRLTMTSPSAATRSANRYSKQHGLRLP